MSFWLCPREILVRRFVSFSLAILTFCLYYIVPISLTFFALPRIGSRNTTPSTPKKKPRTKMFFGGVSKEIVVFYTFYYCPSFRSYIYQNPVFQCGLLFYNYSLARLAWFLLNLRSSVWISRKAIVNYIYVLLQSW